MTGPESDHDPAGNKTPFIEPNMKPVKMRGVKDGTTKTALFGERHHFDPNFDANLFEKGQKSRWPIAQIGAWGWTGGGNGSKQVCAWSRTALKSTTPVVAASTYRHVNRRLSAFGSAHTGGANFTMADGSARFVSEDVSATVLEYLCTRDSGLVESYDDE